MDSVAEMAMNPIAALDKAAAILGSRMALSRALGLSQNAVSEMRRHKRIPEIRAIQIERLTLGRVTRKQLRPDVDWSLYT